MIRFRSWLIAITLLIGGEQAIAQLFDREKETLPSRQTTTTPALTMPTSAPPAMDAPISAETYFIGPSDVMLIGIWTSPPITFTLTVTPEGTLVIPTVGEVKVSDKTLAAVRAEVLTEIRKKYLTGNPTVTLVTPRKVVVTVSGNVRNPGRYIMPASDRVDRAIEEANLIRKDMPNAPEDWEAPRLRGDQKASVRNIALRRRDGEHVRVDIPKYSATRDERWNPMLREGDEIFVPPAGRQKDVVGIYGGVKNPGRFEYAAGDKLTDLIRLAYGFTDRAMKDSLEFTRYTGDTEQLISRFIDYCAIETGTAEDLTLQPGDRIVVREHPDKREDYRISIDGEVRYPGTYPITRRWTKLSEVLKMAGGFTEHAALQSAELIRSTVSPSDLEMERLLSLRGDVSPEDSAYYVLETELRIRKERVTVDFERLVLRGDTTQDVYLRTEDRIYVPSTVRTVYVFGQVVTPGNIPFVPGADASYYVGKAGGETDNARLGDLMIIKRSTRQWLAPDETTIEAGDQVWVPKEPERSFAWYMNIFGQTASVISVAVSVVLLVVQLNK